MRVATVALIGVLIVPTAIKAQAQVRTAEFAATGFLLNLNIPNYMVANRDGTPLMSGPGFWLAIKNTTAIPFSLCTAGFASAIISGTGPVMGGGTEGCSPWWIVLPGETHFQAVRFAVPIPAEPDTRLGVSISLEGKPLGAPGNIQHWSLSWTGTVQEAVALGSS